MAKPKSTAAPAAVTPEAAAEGVAELRFEITVSRVVPKVFGCTFRPGTTYDVKERVKDALGDAIATAVPIQPPPT